MSRCLKIIILCFCLCELFGCASVVVGGLCAAQYPFESKPAFTRYSYSVAVTYIKNGVPVRLDSTMQCAYKGKACNAAVGIYDKWEATFSGGEHELSIESFFDDTSLVVMKPYCKNSLDKVKEREVFTDKVIGAIAYSAVNVYAKNGGGDGYDLLPVGKLKADYGIESLVAEYRKIQPK